MPRKVLEMTATGFLKLKNFDAQRVIENRIEALEREKTQTNRMQQNDGV